jgi:hypothetical protein
MRTGVTDHTLSAMKDFHCGLDDPQVDQLTDRLKEIEYQQPSAITV